ncbi:MAG TPA: flagellar biosynthesis protein FlgL [Pseudolabrys sp.]|nr:flagellar biosynthesis protein FlgL [Pseudolabrys sp.]
MPVNSISSTPNALVQSLMDMRAQFDDLQRQLSTGQKSATYAGLGSGRGLSVSLNAQLSQLSGFDNSIDMVDTRLQLAQTSLGGMATIGNNMKALVVQGDSTGGNASSAQLTAQSSLQQLLGLLNAQAGGRYLFSGRATDQPAVETYDHIVNGDGARAGLKQLIDERAQADLGASGLGRLTVGTTASSVTVDEDTGPFGFKLASASSGLSNATVTGPTGSPANLTVNFTGQPSDGDTLTLRLNMPDGTSENLTLTATTQSPPGNNQFTIGGSIAATVSNLQGALSTSLGTLAATSLRAASAVTASNDFFSADVNNPPQRVSGPPFDTATAMTAGTTANTVIWYTGDAGTDPARGTATTRVDPSLVVSYGTRANETGLRTMVQNVATLAAVTLSPSDPNESNFTSALGQRVGTGLTGTPGQQTVTDIEAELAGVQQTIASVKSRHQQTTATLNDMVQQISGVSNEQVGSELLTLQTRMQASMQTTAMLYQISLVNYLK